MELYFKNKCVLQVTEEGSLGAKDVNEEAKMQ